MNPREDIFRGILRMLSAGCLAASLVAFVAAPAAWPVPRHGVSPDGKVKYPPGFSHYGYANPSAPKGGRIVLSRVVKFDKLNPFSLKGNQAPFILRIFDTLGDASMDEPFSLYGLLAESIDIPGDGLSVTFKLRSQARFADGRPVTAADVVFTLNVLRSKTALPFYRFFYRDVKSVKALNRKTVRFEFSRRNRELPMILAGLEILPRHFYGKGDFGRDYNTKSLGSGPYRVKDYEFGRFIRYERNRNYWGRNLNVNKGRYNFDEILVKIYGDPTVRKEGLKSGEFDFLWVSNSKDWATTFRGKQWDKGWIGNISLKHQTPAGMQGYVFNLRKSIFKNREVRKALALAMDFDWSNRNLFYGQYTANDSYFDNSELGATGLPSPEEFKILEPLRGQLPPAVFTEPMGVEKPQRSIRQRLREAKRLLANNGWKIKNRKLVNVKTGRPMRFTVLMFQPAFARITEPFINNMKRLGVQADMKRVDSSIYEQRLRNFNYDMIVSSWGQAPSPGNEQMNYWHSRSANQPGSRNMIGLKDPAVDKLVETLIGARSRKALVTATRALDRDLWHGNYVVPHWFIGFHRVSIWNKFQRPERNPLYFQPWSFLHFWWTTPDLQARLKQARKSAFTLPKPR